MEHDFSSIRARRTFGKGGMLERVYELDEKDKQGVGTLGSRSWTLTGPTGLPWNVMPQKQPTSRKVLEDDNDC